MMDLRGSHLRGLRGGHLGLFGRRCPLHSRQPKEERGFELEIRIIFSMLTMASLPVLAAVIAATAAAAPERFDGHQVRITRPPPHPQPHHSIFFPAYSLILAKALPFLVGTPSPRFFLSRMLGGLNRSRFGRCSGFCRRPPRRLMHCGRSSISTPLRTFGFRPPGPSKATGHIHSLKVGHGTQDLDPSRSTMPCFPGGRVGAAVDVRVVPGAAATDELLALIGARLADLNSTVMVPDVQKLVDDEASHLNGPRRHQSIRCRRHCRRRCHHDSCLPAANTTAACRMSVTP